MFCHEMDLSLALLLGLLGSLHCAAMCGPLMLALPVAEGGTGRFAAGRIVYHLGRVTTYALLGFIAGLVGKSLLLVGIQRWLSIGLGVLILLGFFLSKKAAVSTPVVRFVIWLKSAMSTQLRRRTFSSLTLLGLLNGLLPCGLVYVALAAAVTQKNILSAVTFMALFGGGTLPIMLAASLFGKCLSPSLRMKLRGAIPLGVLLLAALLILRGLSLGIPYVSPDLSLGGSGCCPH